MDFISHFLPLCRQYLSHLFLQTLLCYPVSPYYANPGFSPIVRPWRYLLHFPSKIAPKYNLIVMLIPLHFVYSLRCFRLDIGGIASGLFICCPWQSLTTACWYMCVSGKSLNALVARDKTRSAQSSRSSSGVWRALLNWTWEFSKTKPFF